MPEYLIVENSKNGIVLRGENRSFWACKEHEQILSGPTETGKTFTALQKLDALCWKYPGAQAAIVRKKYVDIAGSVCQSFEKKVANMNVVKTYGGSRVERYIYPNGSTIWLGGMDNPGKVLSAERDFIYVNQAEQLGLGDWETLGGRATGRAGNSPYALIMGDCNPEGSKHWIIERSRSGPLKLFRSLHVDNPTLYDDDGNLTDRGRKTMQILESYTGIRRERLLLGKWVTAEGAVYPEFNYAVHVAERNPDEMKRWGLAMDEGYTNPAVILLIGEDSDGRLHVFDEYYHTGKLQSEVVKQAREWYNKYKCSMCVVDNAAAGLIAELKDNSIYAIGAKGRVLDGIRAVQDYFKVQGDGKPRLTFSPKCANSINDFESYVWKPGKDEPVKEFDHSPDALRYYISKNKPVEASTGIDPFETW